MNTDIPAAKLLFPRKLLFKVIVRVPWLETNPLHVLPNALHILIPYVLRSPRSMVNVHDVSLFEDGQEKSPAFGKSTLSTYR